jgi:hypothetical protein
VSGLLRVIPLLATVVFLVVLWRRGYRGEVTRIVLAAFTLYTASRAMGATSGGIAFLLALVSSASCVAIIFRKSPEHSYQGAGQDGYLDQPEPAGDPEPVIDSRYDSGGLADRVRRDRERASRG